MYLIKNGNIHLPQGKVVRQDILIEGKKICKLGENLSGEGAEIIDASNMEVFPGMILPATSVGICDFTSLDHPDHEESAAPINPALSVKYALDMRQTKLQGYEKFGITSFGACPGGRAIVAGQGALYHTYGNTAAAMEVKDPIYLKVNFCKDVKGWFGGKGQAPMTRMGMASMLRGALTEAKNSMEHPAEGAPADPGREVLIRALKGELPVLANVYTSAEAAVMLDLCQEFGFRLILHDAFNLSGLTERIIQMKDQVSVLIGSQYSYGYAVYYETDYTLYRKLLDAGVTVGLSDSGDNLNSGRELMLWSAAKLVREGFTPAEVMDMMTVGNAVTLGVSDRVGSIDPGKNADIVLWSADPSRTFQARVLLCMEDGKVVFTQEAVAYEAIPAAAAAPLPVVPAADSYLIRNAALYGTESGEAVYTDLLIAGGKIAKIGPCQDSEAAYILDAKGYNVLPGLVDAHNHQGGIGITDPQGMDLNEMTDPVTPQVSALDGVDIHDPNFRSIPSSGVTTVCLTPGSGNVICGQVIAAKTSGGNLHDMVIKNPCALKMALGGNPKGVYGKKGAAPMTRMGIAAVIHDHFEKASDYKKQKEAGKNPPYNQKYEATLPALRGDVPLKIHCEQFDMITAIEVAKKYGCSLTIEHAWAANDYYEELIASGCYINFGPCGVPEGYGELTGANLEFAAELARRDAKVTLITDAPIFSQDVVYPHMGEVIRAGIPYGRVLKMVTQTPAAAIGVADRVGAIQVGMDADLAVFAMLPGVDTGAKCCLVFQDGKPVFQRQ